MAVIHADDATFEHEVLDATFPSSSTSGPPWCGPCRAVRARARSTRRRTRPGHQSRQSRCRRGARVSPAATASKASQQSHYSVMGGPSRRARAPDRCPVRRQKLGLAAASRAS